MTRDAEGKSFFDSFHFALGEDSSNEFSIDFPLERLLRFSLMKFSELIHRDEMKLKSERSEWLMKVISNRKTETYEISGLFRFSDSSHHIIS
jgi:hypothetical protein